ncbi:MAG: glycosyltransferase [Planctomycetes bacterium]|nr:glycosyltransferase [Planctomycetota bacterium]
MNKPSSLKIVLYTFGLPFTGNSLEHQALGGAETAFIYVARELSQLGHEVLAFCHCSEEGIFDEVEYRAATRFEEWRRSGECDLLICSRYFEIFRAPIKARLKVLWNHDNLVPETVKFMQHVLHEIDYLYCLSDFQVQQYQELLAAFQPVIKKNSNGVDFSLIDEATKGVRKKRHKIMYISRPERGLLQALDIYAALEDKELQFQACSYGYPGEEGKDRFGAEYLRRIQELQEQGYSVEIDRFTKKELYRHISESKVVIFPNLYTEIFCIGAVEVQACKTVFLTSDNSALRETVGYPNLPGADKESFVIALKQLLANEEYRRQLEEQGWQHVRLYSWKNVAQTFLTDAFEFFEKTSAGNQATQFENMPLPPPPPDWTSLTKDGRKLPKISCLTVTSRRLRLLKEAIQCFCSQSYPNRELVIVSHNDTREREAIERYLRSLGRKDIRHISLETEGYSLGRARNASLDAATGELICIWDDDDLYHPDRLSYQFQALNESSAQACFLTDHLQFFEQERELYWVDWRFGGHLDKFERLVPGTMMMYKDKSFRYPESGTQARVGEDNVFVDALRNKQVKVAAPTGLGFLYLYRCHGDNTHPSEHFRHIQAFGSQEQHFIEQRKVILLTALKQYQLPVPLVVKNRTQETMFVYDH